MFDSATLENYSDVTKMSRLWNVLTRRKVLEPSEGVSGNSKLARVLNTFDLTALGVGSTLGVGVYVLAGHVAKDSAGPSVILSFLIAGIASVFAGLCYAEFGARAPRAGSAYIYSYVSVGEFVAFVIGWNLILEYVIGSASVARGLTLYVDSLINDTLKNTFTDIAPINLEYMSSYFDFCSCGISILLAAGLAFGVKESSITNNIFTVLNMAVVLFVIIAGATKADTDNWYVPANETNSAIGEGGFFPFGVEGMIKGAATCFYGFIGFDCIATTGEEVRNPQKAIPLAIILSLTIIFLSYFGISTVITLMVPYYNQNENAPIPHAFEEIGWYWAKWVVAIGGIFGLCASLFGAMFPLPRIIYAMASDGLVFKFLGNVHDKYSTPVVGTLIAGLLTGLMAALFELKQLVNMMSIGTLLAYTIVAACVLLLRFLYVLFCRFAWSTNSYAEDKEEYILIRRYSSSSEESIIYRDFDGGLSITNKEPINDSEDNSYSSNRVIYGLMSQYFNFSRHKYPTKLSETLVNINVILYCILCLSLGLCIIYVKDNIVDGIIWAIVIICVIVGLMLLTILSIWLQPTSNTSLSFKVPFVPLIPALSIFINIYLMLMLDVNTWIRFGVWMLIGVFIYFYSVKIYSWKQPYSTNLIIGCSSNIVNGKLSNGHTNIGFIANEESIEEMDELPPMEEVPIRIRKSRAPLPPIIVRKSSVDIVLDNFDDAIDDWARQFSVDTQTSSVLDSPIAETVTVTAVIHSKPTLNLEHCLEPRYSQASNDKCIITTIRKSQESTDDLSDAAIIFDVKQSRNNTIDEDAVNDSGTASIEYKESDSSVSYNEEIIIHIEPTKETHDEVIDVDETVPTIIQPLSDHFNTGLGNSSDNEREQSSESILHVSQEDKAVDNNLVEMNKVEEEGAPPPPPPPLSPLFTSRKSVKKSKENPADKFNTFSIVPPPPLPPLADGSKTMPKRPSFRQTSMATMFNEIRDNKPILRKTSPKLRTRKHSIKDDFADVEEIDDNVKFGSKQHEKIRKTLGQLFDNKSAVMLFKKNTYIMPTVSFNVQPRATTEIPQLKINVDGSVDEVPTEDIKKILTKFLNDRSSAIGPSSSKHTPPVLNKSLTNSSANESKPEPVEEVKSETIANVTEEMPTQQEHVRQMRNTLTAINKGLVNDLKKTFSENN